MLDVALQSEEKTPNIVDANHLPLAGEEGEDM